MSDGTPTAPSPAAAAAPRPRDAEAPARHDPSWTRERFDELFRRGVFVILMVVLLVATLRAYMAIERSIIVWLEYQYVPLAQAVLSVVVLALAAWLIRSYVIARAK